MARVVRLLIYDDDPVHLKATINNSFPFNGKAKIGRPTLTLQSLVLSADGIYCLRCNKETSNTSLYCDECEADNNEPRGLKWPNRE